MRIGEFGIGKFAVLSICDRFEIFTRSGNYAATLIFDRQDFENRSDWNIPLIEHEIVKKVRIGGSEFLVSFAHLGDEEKESFTEGGIIFINRDHKLFKKVEKMKDLVLYHLIRLITQEIIKLTVPRNLELAYDWQGKLIRDAYLSVKEEAS